MHKKRRPTRPTRGYFVGFKKNTRFLGGNIKPTKTNSETNTTNNDQRTTHISNILFINLLIYYSIEKFRALLVRWFVGRCFCNIFQNSQIFSFSLIWGSSGVRTCEQKKHHRERWRLIKMLRLWLTIQWDIISLFTNVEPAYPTMTVRIPDCLAITCLAMRLAVSQRNTLDYPNKTMNNYNLTRMSLGIEDMVVDNGCRLGRLPLFCCV